MLSIVESIYKMVGTMVQLPDDESTPEMRVDKVNLTCLVVAFVEQIFNLMDINNDGMLTMEEFKEGSKKDPSILHALSLSDGLV